MPDTTGLSESNERPCWGQREALVVGVLLLVLMVWAYWPALSQTVATWGSSADYSHGYLVLPLAIWFLWARRDSFPKGQLRPAWGGLLLVCLAAAIRVFAGRIYVPRLDVWTIPLWLGGVCWLIGGPKLLRWCGPSIAFLWFMFPLPGRVEVFLSAPLQRIATSFSTWILQCLGQPAVAEGTTILLEHEVVDVARACSGLRVFFGIAALAVGYALVFRTKLWTTLLLLAGVLPVALIANAVRVTGTVLMYQYASGEAARAFSHDFAGLVVIPLAVLLFGGIALVVARLERQLRESESRTRFIVTRSLVALAALAVMIPLGYMWHSYQATTTLLGRASALESEQNWSEAAMYVGRYLRLRPDDTEALVRLALLFDKSELSQQRKLRALTLFSNARAAAPERTDLRRREAELALDLRRFDAALESAQGLLEKHREGDSSTIPPDMAAAAKVKALAIDGLLTSETAQDEWGWQDAVTAFQAAIEANPADLTLPVRLAEIYRDRLSEPEEAERQELADAVIEQMVRNNSQLPAAWLARYRYRRTLHEKLSKDEPLPAEVEADLDRAIQLGRENPEHESSDAILAAGLRAQKRGQIDNARDLFKHAIEVDPDDHRGYVFEGLVEATLETPEAKERAVKVWRKGLERVGPDEPDLVLPLARMLYDLGEADQAEQLLKPLDEKVEAVPEPFGSWLELSLAMLRAEAQAAAGQSKEAASLLAPLLVDQATRAAAPALRSQHAGAWIRLGDFYAQAKAWDQAARAYEEAGQLNPQVANWHLKAGNAFEMAGQPRRSAMHYEVVTGENPKAWLALARVHLQDQIRRPREEQDWREFRRAITNAADTGTDAAALALMSVEYLLAQGGDDAAGKARDVLNKVLDQQPDSSLLWAAMAKVQQQLGDNDAALQAVEEYERCSADASSSLPLKAEILAQTGKLDEAKKALEDKLKTAPAEQDFIIRYQLAQLAYQTDRLEGRRQLRALTARYPENLLLADQLAQLAWQSRDWSDLEKCESRLRQIEGQDGTVWRLYRALRLLDQVRDTGDAQFPEVVRLHAEIQNLRPDWHRASMLGGRIAQRQGQFRQAIEAYQDAIRLGSDSVIVAEPLIGLLIDEGRFAEASRQFNRVRQLAARSTRLSSLAIPIYVQKGEMKQALKVAQEWVRREPDDPNHYIRLARTILLTTPPDSAEADEAMRRSERVFRRAVEIQPSEVMAWVELFRFYLLVRRDQQAAISTLREMSDHPEIETGRKAYALAQLHLVMGNTEEAGAFYRQAAKLASDEIRQRVLERAAQFFRFTDPQLAEQYCREAIERDPGSAPAQLVLVGLLAQRGQEDDLEEAFETLQRVQESGIQSADSLRMEAGLRLRRGRTDDRARALKILEDLAERPDEASPHDLVQLALLLEQEGRVLRAYNLLRSLADQDAPSVLLVAYAGFLMRNATENPQFARQLEETLTRLEANPANATTALRLRLQALKRLTPDEPPEHQAVADVVDRYVQQHIQPLAKAGQDNERIAPKPAVLNLLLILLKEDLGAEAVRLCKSKPSVLDPAEWAAQLATALTVMDPPDDLLRLAEPVLADAAGEYPDDGELMFSLGVLRHFQGRGPEARQLLRRALTAKPDSIETMNMLAIVLGGQPEGQSEALQIIENAISLAGRQPTLLDTQAVILLRQGKTAEALELLVEATSVPLPKPGPLLHLAAAYHQAGDMDQAREAFSQAYARNLGDAVIGPADRELIDQLEEQFGSS